MTTIIAGTFDNLPKAQRAVQDLHVHGCRDDDIHVFHNNASGQHGAFPIGGDEMADPPDARCPAGVVVAVQVPSGTPEAEVERILKQDGASTVEKAEGEWGSGEWQDFDPVAAPQPVDQEPPEILYRIAPGGRGQWNVFEGGAGKLLSDFHGRDEAINYATALASAKPKAVVEIYRAGGELESSRAFSAPQGPTRRRRH